MELRILNVKDYTKMIQENKSMLDLVANNLENVTFKLGIEMRIKFEKI